MRYSGDHKSEVHKRIVRRAAKVMRASGSWQVGIQKLMSSVGMTHGAFYGHFRSREELVLESFTSAIDETIEKWRNLQKAKGTLAVVTDYVGARHRDSPESGCAIPGFIEEIGRGSPAGKRLFSDKLTEMAQMLRGPSDNPDHSCREPMAMLALMVGAVTLSRACGRGGVSDEILQASRRGAARLCSYQLDERPEETYVASHTDNQLPHRAAGCSG
jgi:TetR/AcrR family transcriptional repressor of nem operon